mmetsp:Transcript_10551/g.7886  ORF Transcript_10551/g.7886 Transcript_10551/m.7886 type:complete len:89 (+) Transcript_10551:189-455(+)
MKQAALLLKLRVNEDWLVQGTKDKENQQNGINQATQRTPLTDDEKLFIKTNIFSAMDHCQDKVIMSCFENIIYNIAQTDYPNNWHNCL